MATTKSSGIYTLQLYKTTDQTVGGKIVLENDGCTLKVLNASGVQVFSDSGDLYDELMKALGLSTVTG